MAYLIGERLGAITFLEPTFIVVSWMAPGWLVLMLFFHLLMGRQNEGCCSAVLAHDGCSGAQAADWLAGASGRRHADLGPFTVYTSQLRTPDGRYSRDDQDQALIITYARDIDRDELVEATRDQWQAQGS